MKRLAFLFSGQGSQHEGMGLDFIEWSPVFRERYEIAQKVLGWPPAELSQPEKKSDLNITIYTQPCIYIVSCVIAEALIEANAAPHLTAGHSAGEFAALTAAGAWDFETGLRVIAERARLMHETSKPGAMAAVLGLAPEIVELVCEEWPEGVVRAANFNSPKQTVITGEPEAVQAVAPVLKEKGARRVLPLKVSGAFHSPLMKEAQQQFAEFLERIEIQDLRIPWISNNTAKAVVDAAGVREHIVKQFCEPVRWVDSMDVVQKECDLAVEVGPGEVLKGLVKACLPDFPCCSTDSVEGIKEALSRIFED
ncbi:MAG: ACP S-malonyltransferase [Candidatus Omnitrophica bacterium]|nr:ACP S-malonyltransferase [Candidatus Omnitrophota bacterium]